LTYTGPKLYISEWISHHL